jgi:hypothetical protein
MNLQDFNDKFNDLIKKSTQQRLLYEKAKLQDIDEIENIDIQIYNLTIKELFINIKTSLFKLFTLENGILLNNDDYFFLGLFFVIIYVIYAMLFLIFNN